MNTLKTIQLFALSAVLLTGCGETGDRSAQSDREAALARHRWQLISFAVDPIPEAIPDSLDAWLEFQDQKIRGAGGCNSFGGSYHLKQSELQITGFSATEMFCADRSRYEEWFFNALQNSREVRVSTDRLEILCGDLGGLVFRPATE